MEVTSRSVSESNCNTIVRQGVTHRCCPPGGKRFVCAPEANCTCIRIQNIVIRGICGPSGGASSCYEYAIHYCIVFGRATRTSVTNNVVFQIDRRSDSSSCIITPVEAHCRQSSAC